jgi:hypothetical protein
MWPNVVKTIERGQYFLVYISKAQFFYLPKYAFEGIRETEDFWEFTHRNAGLKKS